MKIDTVGLAKLIAVCENVIMGAEVDGYLWSTTTRAYEEEEEEEENDYEQVLRSAPSSSSLLIILEVYMTKPSFRLSSESSVS